ncbi:MAG: hypothetical protein ACO2PL_11275 [Armatimonadota bacterium]|jgi:hypothetical protein
MTTDEKVELAQQMAGQLVGVVPSEWRKWCSYASRKGLRRALQLARCLQHSPSLRLGQRQSYQSIAKVIASFQVDLANLSQDDFLEVLGYATRWLFARRETQYAERSRRQHDRHGLR